MSTTVQQVPTGTYLVDPVHSNVGFSIKAAGLSGFRGTFGAYDARLEDGVLSGSGALESLQIAEEQLKGALLSPMFFDAERFPSVAFTSTAGWRGRASPMDESRTAGNANLELLLLARLWGSCPTTTSDSTTVERVVRVGRPEGCRPKREKSLLAASLWMLVQEPDVDSARVPAATGAPIRRHRRRDRNRRDGVGDQPSPSR